MGFNVEAFHIDRVRFPGYDLLKAITLTVNQEETEIEVRFLDIDEADLKARLATLGAEDLGMATFRETIYSDASGSWQGDDRRLVRLRDTGEQVTITYKHFASHSIDGTREIEVTADDFKTAGALLEAIGLIPHRRQEKIRHAFRIGEVRIEFDRWPQAPTYLEIEGPSQEAVREAAESLGLSWDKADTHNAAWVLENVYGIPVTKLAYFTFERVD